MDNGTINAGYLLRLVGFFGIAIGIAWAVQTLGFGHEAIASRLMWAIAAASVSGAGVGLIVAATGLEADRTMQPARA